MRSWFSRDTQKSIDHVTSDDLARYRELTGAPPPSDTLFGPPVFDSNFGPTRQFYFDAARSAAAARRPARMPSAAGVAPGSLAEVARRLWDSEFLACAARFWSMQKTGSGRSCFAARGQPQRKSTSGIPAELAKQRSEGFNGWSFIGAARFIKDYFGRHAAGAPAHLALIDNGIEQLHGMGMIGVAFSSDACSALERERLSATTDTVHRAST